MSKENIIEELKDMIENKISKVGNDGTRYYTLSREEIEEIIEALER